MRTRNLFITTLILLVVSTGAALASPVELYLVKFAPGTDIYRLAGSQNWPLYHISSQQALMGKQLSKSDNNAVLESNQIYYGPSENLRWVHLKRNSPMPAIKVMYFGKDMLLTESGSVTAAEVKSEGELMIKSFNPQPIVMVPAAVIRSSSLARDTTIATLTHLVDIAGVTADVESLQAFNTRSTAAPNHEQVTEWIRDEFLSYGITDVVIDSFVDPSFTSYTQSYFGNSETYKIRNVIATIPGALDTESVYVVGGHFDTSVWPYNPWAPGADDNGSGTTAVLQTARVLAANPPNTTIKLIAFDCEEWGLYGSEHYAAQALAQGMKVQCMLNYDMVGSIGNDSLFVSKLYPGSEAYAYLLGQMATWYGRTTDTNLVPIYNSVYLNGSDSWEFYLRGLPVTYSEEYNFSPVYHQTNDSTTYMNMRYCTSIIKTGMGLLGTLANYPQKVNGLTIIDVGNGSQLYVQWQPNTAGNIVGYKVYWGKSSGSYTDSMQVSGTSYTIGSLLADSLYYIGIIAIDDGGKEGPIITEVTGTPQVVPLSPLGLASIPMIMSIKLDWHSGGELDLAGYRIYRKIDQGIWDSLNSALVADTMYVDSVPSETARYWYRIRAIDTDGNASPLSDSVDSYTYAPTGLAAMPIVNGITLNWPVDSTINIVGYRLYRKINQGTLDSLLYLSVPDTSYTDGALSGANKYYYRFRAFDAAGNASRLSDSVYGRPITLDQGILVVDETNNWTLPTYPNDAKQDSFYNYILSDHNVTPYEYGSTLQKPILADFGPYSTVAWFADDYSWLMASGAMADIKTYLDNGGKLWFTGWKPTGDIRNDVSYAADFAPGSFIYDYLKISHAGLSAYTDLFQAATGLLDYPSISVDPVKVPIGTWLGTMRYIESLTPVSTGEGIYAMDMKNDGSVFEGQVCAVRDSGKTVLFGFPLYFMDKDQAKLAAQKIMEEFGEPYVGVEGKPDDRERIMDLRLYQNIPNPFDKQTTISYQLPKAGWVRLDIYNIAGQLVKTLANLVQPAGSYAVKWDGRDNKNRQVSAGVYIYHLTAGDKTQSRKMIVLK